MAKEDNNLLEYNFEELFGKIDLIINKICVEYSHILLLSPGDANIIIGLNENIYQPIIHISQSTYLAQVNGYVFHKNIDPFIKRTFDEM